MEGVVVNEVGAAKICVSCLFTNDYSCNSIGRYMYVTLYH